MRDMTPSGRITCAERVVREQRDEFDVGDLDAASVNDAAFAVQELGRLQRAVMGEDA